MLGADSSKDNRPVVQRALPFGVIDCECAIGWRPRSQWLTTLPSGAPWHNPRLFEAVLKIPYATAPRRAARVTSPGP